MENKMDLYLISGFLGSGKTTLLQNILKDQDTKRVGVIVNEFGSVGIDGKLLQDGESRLVEINNGSIFCACLKDGFVKTLAAFLKQPVDRLYVEASGMADPSSIELLLQRLEPLLQKKFQTERRYHYCGSICVVDAGNFLDISDLFLPSINQVKKCNLVVVNKTDTVTEEGLREVHDAIREIHPEVEIYDTTFAKVPDVLLRKYLIGEAEEVGESVNAPWNRPFTGVLELSGSYAPEKLREFLEKIAPQMLRMKGFFKSADRMYYVSCVEKDVKIQEVTQPGEAVREQRQLVLIAREERDLTEWLRAQWEAVFEEDFLFEED